MKKKLVLASTAFLLVFITGVYSDERESYASASVETLAVTTESWDGEDLPWYPWGNPEVTILKITVPPGVQLVLHRHPIPLVAYMLSGELSVETEFGSQHAFLAGDTIVEVVDTWHFGASTGTEPAVLIAFYMGVEGIPNTIKKN